MKSVQISEELFLRLCYYHIVEHTADGEAYIQQALEDKLDAMKRRELYSKAVKGDSMSRKQYLDMVGISKDFRW